MLTSLHFSPEPRHKLGAADVEFLLSNEVPHFVPSLFAVLLRYHDPAVIVLFVLGQQLLKGRGVYCELGTDAIRPESLDDLDPGCAEDSCVETGNEDITLCSGQCKQLIDRGEEKRLTLRVVQFCSPAVSESFG